MKRVHEKIGSIFCLQIRNFSLSLSHCSFFKKRLLIYFTDNCSELREALRKAWNSELLLCVIHLLQQVWRWLHHAKSRIAKIDRPMLLSLFKKIVYANEFSELEEFYDDLQSAVIVQKYPIF